MPNYDYLCTKCGNKEEKFLWLSQIKFAQKCSKCNSEMKRLIGKGSTVIFKGKGFFCNDYKKKK